MANLIPAKVERLSEVPTRLAPLFESDPTTDGFRLGRGGHLLARYRKLAAENPGVEPPSPAKTTLDRSAWTTLVGVAEPGTERAYLIRQAAAGKILVKD